MNRNRILLQVNRPRVERAPSTQVLGASNIHLSAPQLQELAAVIAASVNEDLYEEGVEPESRSQSSEEPNLTDEEIQQADEANLVAEETLADAKESGVWSKEDAERFDLALSKMPSELAFEADRQLSVAINNQEVVPANDIMF